MRTRSFEEIMEYKNTLHPLRRGLVYLFLEGSTEVIHSTKETMEALRVDGVQGYYVDHTGWVYLISPDEDTDLESWNQGA